MRAGLMMGRPGASAPPVATRAWFSDLLNSADNSQSDANVTDAAASGGFPNGKWKQITGTGSAEITTRPNVGYGFGDGFPRVWEVVMPIGSVSRMIDTTAGQYGSPAIGQMLAYRGYFNCQYPNSYDTGGTANHQIESNGLGVVAWQYKWFAIDGAGVIDLWFNINPGQTYPTQRQYSCVGVGMTTNTPVRVEWLLYLASATIALPLCYLYNASTQALIAGPTQFIERTSGASLQAEFNSATALIDMSVGGGVNAQFQDWLMGNNGPTHAGGPATMLFGPAAVSTPNSGVLLGPWINGQG